MGTITFVFPDLYLYNAKDSLTWLQDAFFLLLFNKLFVTVSTRSSFIKDSRRRLERRQAPRCLLGAVLAVPQLNRGVQAGTTAQC